MKECSGSISRGFLLNRKKEQKDPCICLCVMGEKMLVSRGAQVVLEACGCREQAQLARAGGSASACCGEAL